MRATGCIRRIDDLGRVVIPKEIRRSLHIREGDPLEIYTEHDSVIFKRYDPSSYDPSPDWNKILDDLKEEVYNYFDIYTSEDYELKKEIGVAIDKIRENFKKLQERKDNE